MDPNYEKNMKGAMDNGVQAAPYVYLQTKTVEEAKVAAKYAVEKVSGYKVPDRCGCRVKIYPGAFGSGAHGCGKRIM